MYNCVCQKFILPCLAFYSVKISFLFAFLVPFAHILSLVLCFSCTVQRDDELKLRYFDHINCFRPKQWTSFGSELCILNSQFRSNVLYEIVLKNLIGSNIC